MLSISKVLSQKARNPSLTSFDEYKNSAFIVRQTNRIIENQEIGVCSCTLYSGVLSY